MGNACCAKATDQVGKERRLSGSGRSDEQYRPQNEHQQDRGATTPASLQQQHHHHQMTRQVQSFSSGGVTTSHSGGGGESHEASIREVGGSPGHTNPLQAASSSPPSSRPKSSGPSPADGDYLNREGMRAVGPSSSPAPPAVVAYSDGTTGTVAGAAPTTLTSNAPPRVRLVHRHGNNNDNNHNNALVNNLSGTSSTYSSSSGLGSSSDSNKVSAHVGKTTGGTGPFQATAPSSSSSMLPAVLGGSSVQVSTSSALECGTAASGSGSGSSSSSGATAASAMANNHTDIIPPSPLLQLPEHSAPHHGEEGEADASQSSSSDHDPFAAFKGSSSLPSMGRLPSRKLLRHNQQQRGRSGSQTSQNMSNASFSMLEHSALSVGVMSANPPSLTSPLSRRDSNSSLGRYELVEDGNDAFRTVIGASTPSATGSGGLGGSGKNEDDGTGSPLGLRSAANTPDFQSFGASFEKKKSRGSLSQTEDVVDGYTVPPIVFRSSGSSHHLQQHQLTRLSNSGSRSHSTSASNPKMLGSNSSTNSGMVPTRSRLRKPQLASSSSTTCNLEEFPNGLPPHHHQQAPASANTSTSSKKRVSFVVEIDP